MSDSFLFHDYETFGADPARDGLAQFAAIRTDPDLRPIGRPVSIYCQPVVDRLPQPEACLITGITPQRALAEGICEAEFAAEVYAQMSRPGTCALGYNSIRFDDAFTRHLLWRNLFDPYVREWKHGNSRFDLIDLARLCYALRPDGIQWPRHETGQPSFRLEHLALANALEQQRAHDALSDVQATLALAQLIRRTQPRLWTYALGLRSKRHVAAMLDWVGGTALLHTSEKYPAERGCTTLVLPVGPAPGSDQGVIVVDLMADPDILIHCEIDDLRDRLFTPGADLPEGVERPAIKTVHANRCPMLAPATVLDGVDLARIGLDPARCEEHRQRLLAGTGLREKLSAVLQRDGAGASQTDVELGLYGGGFPDPAERARLDRARATGPEELAGADFGFVQPRHSELLWRRRARNWPDTLSDAEHGRWREFVAERLAGSHPLSLRRDAPYGLDEFRSEIATLRTSRPPGPDHAVLDQLDAWGNGLEAKWLI